MKEIVFAYVPVLHRGYQEFFAKYQNADLYLLSREELLKFPELEYLKKDIRVLDVDLVQQAINSWHIFNTVESIKNKDLEQLSLSDDAVAIFSDDDIGHFIADRFFNHVTERKFEPIFLRWDEKSMDKPQEVLEGVRLSKDDFEKEIMLKAFVEAGKSSDWWRHVGSLLIKDSQVMAAAYNKHLPSNDQQYKVSDPRITFRSGVGIEFASSIHAEAGLIARAAKDGISLNNAAIYVTTFPCPVCAKQIAEAGIKKVYYAKGYALLDGLEIFKAYGIEVILIDFSAKELSELNEMENANCLVKKRYDL